MARIFSIVVIAAALTGGAVAKSAVTPGPLTTAAPITSDNLPGRTWLPAQVPYLNSKQRYPIGNGIAMAVGDASGGWSQLAGPGYTSSNFIQSESLALEVDGVERPLTLDMKRARKTGIYCGVATYGDLVVHLVDFAVRGEPWISRLILIDNTSATSRHQVRIRARVTPLTGKGRKDWLVQAADQVNRGVAMKVDTSLETAPVAQFVRENPALQAGWRFIGHDAKAKTVVMAFTDPATVASRNANTYTLETGVKPLAAKGSCDVLLCHYLRETDEPDGPSLTAIRSLNGVAELQKSIGQWQSWFDQVGPHYRLENIADARARDLVEGALAIMKTNQSQDGGVIANSTCYTQCYIRDAALALRGLAATGHFDELKKWMIWLDNKYGLYKHLPDSVSGEASLKDGSFDLDLGNPDVEETAYYLLCARDYYQGTGDLKTLNAVHTLLQYCMDIQLKDAITNGYRLGFEGDETEIFDAVNVSKTGVETYGHAQKLYWSLSSVAMGAAALDFYIHYLEVRGEDPAAYRNAQTGTTMNLPAELANLLKAMDRDFWRTDLPGLPGGFHDCYRKKSDQSWPLKQIVNFTLMPVYFGAPYAPDRKAKDVVAIARDFNPQTGFLQLVPGVDDGFDGHDLGYLLWSLVETGDSRKDEVYRALVNGPTPDCWGSFNEAYSATGVRNGHDLRSLETGVNVSAIAKYWNLGR